MKYKEVIMRYIYNINKENTVCIYVWTCASHSKIYYDMRVFPVYCFLRHLVGLECHLLLIISSACVT